MANNITNILTVKGETAAVKQFFSGISGGLDGEGKPVLIDFNKIIPMPPSLDIECGQRVTKALAAYATKQWDLRGSSVVRADLHGYSKNIFEEIAKCHANPPTDAEEWRELLKLGEQYYNNIRDYGVPTWYDWRTRTENWGTKWNSYNNAQISDDTIAFDTAWSGVPELMRKSSEQHPDVGLSYKYADEDWGNNAGEFEFEKGEILYEHVPADGSPAALRITESIFGKWNETEDEDENEFDPGEEPEDGLDGEFDEDADEDEI